MQLHDNEGCLFPDDSDPTAVLWSGKIQIKGVVYRVYGTRGTSKDSKPYMQLRAHEQAKTEVRTTPAVRPSSRAAKLCEADQKIVQDYQGLGWK